MEEVEFFAWLKENVTVMQFFAYVSLTITTAIVAILSLRFSFRQNFGWDPIILPVKVGMKGGFTDPSAAPDDQPEEGPDTHPGFFAWIGFDVWNRRAYPIVIESAVITFSQDILDSSGYGRSGFGDVWSMRSDNGYINEERIALDSGKNVSYEHYARLRAGVISSIIDGTVRLSITYFDPRKKRSKTISVSEPYTTLVVENQVGFIRRWIRKVF